MERRTSQTEQPLEERVIAFVLYPGVTPLDLIGPLQVLNSLEAPYRAVVVGEAITPMPTDTAVKLVPDRSFADVPQPFAMVVPGGGAGAFGAMTSGPVREYIQAVAKTAYVTASVCTGSLILAAAGLLTGRAATTHWAYAPLLERLGARYERKRWVSDGPFLTAAGVSAGIDLALYLVAQWTGEATARRIQLGIEYDPQPPFGPIDWSAVRQGSSRIAHHSSDNTM